MKNGKRTALIYIAAILAVILLFAVSVIRVDIYNKTNHHRMLSGDALFLPEKALWRYIRTRPRAR